jgi:putative ABC transport system permease protein
MRPVAPKAGKRIILERIPWIWSHINFSQKAAVRNLVRYKKRLAMTVLGIGGCMGILLVGFGLKDSILSIGTLQFGEVRLYDASFSFEEDASEEEIETFYKKLQEDARIKKWINVKEASVDVCFENQEKSAYLAVPEEPDRITDFVSLKERESGKAHVLSDDGIILTEKIATLLGVEAGDEVTLKDGDDDQKGVTVTVEAVVENYFYHYVFMTPALYEKLYGETPDYRSVYTINTENGETFEETLQEEYMELSCISGVSFVSGSAQRVADMLKSMDSVIVIIVVAAGLLAFVVLYNLNNINISERKRELATLKVLGFYDGEVSHYIFRENIVLTLFGIVAGVGIGIVLHRFVILTAEIDMLMFGRQISLKSYAYSIGLTLLFSFCVNGFMHFKMKKIDMIESLKSVE